jgi:hypothetical protein
MTFLKNFFSQIWLGSQPVKALAGCGMKGNATGKTQGQLKY